MGTFPLPLGFETVSLPENECILRTAMLRFLMQPYWSMSEGGTKTNCFQLVDSFPIDLHTALQDLHCFDSFLYWVVEASM